MKGWKTGDNIHNRITQEWENWLDAHPPEMTTPEEIKEFEDYIDKKYEDEWWESQDNQDDSNKK